MATMGALGLLAMNAMPPIPPGRHRGQGNTGIRWAALSEAGIVVSALAGIEQEKQDTQVRNFPALIRDCEDWRRELAERGVADLHAIMEPGLAALLAINARGTDCRPAALALWQEFLDARAAIVGLLPPSGELGPRRAA